MSASESRPRLPHVPRVVPRNIPDILKREPRWLCWWPGPLKPNGKFDKFTVDPQTGKPISPVDPKNWLPFDEALDAHRRDMAKGIGFALSDQHPIIVGGLPYYVTAIDLDRCAERMDESEALWRELGKPYVELSPSQQGLRMFALCSSPVRGGNAGAGREMYSSKRFMTITGIAGKGLIQDASPGLVAIEKRWFPRTSTPTSTLPAQPAMARLPETPANLTRVLSMLDRVSSDAPYDEWRSIIWAIASTGWVSASEVAQRWSARAPERYESHVVDKLLGAYDPARGITLGTLAHLAKQCGWTEPAPPGVSPIPPTPPVPRQISGPLLTAAELRMLPPVDYLVRGLLPARGLAAIYGEPGSGKSFLALDLAHGLSSGRADWFGFPVKPAPVAYVALEGLAGLSKRVAALEQHTGVPCNADLRFWCQAFHLLNEEGVHFLADQVTTAHGKGAVVMIDTLNQASPGADENSSQDMGRMIANAKLLGDITQGLVVLVHHSGKNRSHGLRGHSSLLAAMDAVFEVVGGAGGRSWQVVKAKDDSSDVRCDFDLVSVEVGQDAFGSITSCAVTRAIRSAAASNAPIRGKHQQAAMTELTKALGTANHTIAYQEALQRVAAVVVTARGKGRDRAKEAIDALIRSGRLLFSDGVLSIVA